MTDANWVVTTAEIEASPYPYPDFNLLAGVLFGTGLHGLRSW